MTENLLGKQEASLSQTNISDLKLGKSVLSSSAETNNLHGNGGSARIEAAHQPNMLDSIRCFAEGLFHGAIEMPINGAVDIANKTGIHLPEIHLVDRNDLATDAGKLGTLTGLVADGALAAELTSGLPLYGRAAVLALATIDVSSDNDGNKLLMENSNQKGI